MFMPRLQSSAQVTAPASRSWQELASNTHSGHKRDCVQGVSRLAGTSHHIFLDEQAEPTSLQDLYTKPTHLTCAQMWGRRSDQDPTGLLSSPAAQQPGWLGGKRLKCCRGCSQQQQQAQHTCPGTSLADSMYKQEEVWLGERAGVPA